MRIVTPLKHLQVKAAHEGSTDASSLNTSTNFRSKLLRSLGFGEAEDVSGPYLDPLRLTIPQHFLFRPGSGFKSVSIHLDHASGNLLTFVFFTEQSEHADGFVHGGAIAAIFDGVAAFVGKKFANGERVWTRVHETRFLKPVAIEREYAIVAMVSKKEVNEKRIKLEVRCELINESGDIFAESDTIVLAGRGSKERSLPSGKL